MKNLQVANKLPHHFYNYYSFKGTYVRPVLLMANNLVPFYHFKYWRHALPSMMNEVMIFYFFFVRIFPWKNKFLKFIYKSIKTPSYLTNFNYLQGLLFDSSLPFWLKAKSLIISVHLHSSLDAYSDRYAY